MSIDTDTIYTKEHEQIRSHLCVLVRYNPDGESLILDCPDC